MAFPSRVHHFALRDELSRLPTTPWMVEIVQWSTSAMSGCRATSATCPCALPGKQQVSVYVPGNFGQLIWM